jgi:hypothetical protein
MFMKLNVFHSSWLDGVVVSTRKNGDGAVNFDAAEEGDVITTNLN